MGLQETSIHSTTVLQPCVKIIIMIKRQSFGDYKRDGLSHVSMLMVTIVNQRHKSTAAMNSSTFIKTSYWKLKIWVLIANFDCRSGDSSLPKLCTKQMSHISLTNLTCDASWIRCMWAADNTAGCLEALVKFTHLHYSGPVPAVPPTVSYCGPSAHCFYHCEK